MLHHQHDKSIIVVDDDKNVCQLLGKHLTDEGFGVRIVHSGEDALDEYQQTPFAIAIVDIHLPGMNGIDLMSELKKINGDIEVVIITSYGSLKTAVSCLRLGAYKYLIKPFEKIETVIAAVKHAHEKVMLTVENKRLLAELQEQNDRLQKVVAILGDRANRDSLTGSYNHRCFQQTIIKEFERAERYNHPFSIVFLDVDYFKHYNDNNGHPAGDEVLVLLACIVERSLRKSDFFARYGGEEFVAILPETPKEAAAKMADHIRILIENHPFANQEEQPNGNLTASFGIAAFPGDAENPASLIEQADKALYRAKDQGRNRLCVCGDDK